MSVATNERLRSRNTNIRQKNSPVNVYGDHVNILFLCLHIHMYIKSQLWFGQWLLSGSKNQMKGVSPI